jgi:hypothetical protein
MKLNSYIQDFGVRPQKQNLEWSNRSHLKSSQQEFQADTWVHLLGLPSTFSFDEALLLCQISEDQWAAWIPDHGEAVLHTRQFCARF